MNETIYPLMIFFLNVVFACAILFVIMFVAKKIIKKAVSEALHEHDKFVKEAPGWEKALKGVEERRRKFL